MRYIILIFFLVSTAVNSVLAQSTVDGTAFIRELVVAGDGKKLQVVVSTERRCMFGDLDLISLDLQHAEKDLTLQLSLEPIVTGAAEPVFGTLVEKGESGALGTYEFLLSETKKPVLMGLYICAFPASEKTKTCGSLPLKTFEQMFKKYQIDMDKAADEAKKNGKLGSVPHRVINDPGAQGNIYFFRFLIVSDSLVEYPDKAMNVDRYNRFFQHARNRGIDTAEIEDIVVQQSRQLGSLPLGSSGSRLQVVLPFYDRDKCSK